MTDARYQDFDQFFAEQDEQPLVITLFGQEWDLPADPPVDALLEQQRVAAEFRRLRTDGLIDAKNRPLDPDTGEPLGPDDEVPAEVAAAMDVDFGRFAGQMLGESNLAEWRRLGLGSRQLQKVLAWVNEQHQSDDDDEGATPGNRSTRRKAGVRQPTDRRPTSSTATDGGR